MVEVDYETSNSSKSFEYMPNGNVKEVTKYYDVPKIDKLPTKPIKSIDTNISSIDNKPLNNFTFINRYNPKTNSWIQNTVPANSLSDKLNQEREEWKRKNIQQQEGGYVDLDLDDDEILELQKGGYIVEYLDDPSIPKLNRAQDGGGTAPVKLSKAEQQKLLDEATLAHLATFGPFKDRKGNPLNLEKLKTANSSSIIRVNPSTNELILPNGMVVPQGEYQRVEQEGMYPYYSFKSSFDDQPIIIVDNPDFNKQYATYYTQGNRMYPVYNKQLYNPTLQQWVQEDSQETPQQRFGGLIKAQSGGQTSCPEGYTWDGKKCTITNPDLELQSVDVSANIEKNKERIKLVDRLQQVKGAYQDWREDAGLRRTRLRNEGASTIEGLKREIAEYKKQLDEEKKMYDRAGKALNVLKKQRPDEWKNAKIGDVLSTKGIEALRSLYSENKISDQTFRDFYNNFGSQYDPNVAEGKGPDRAYSAKEAEKDWMYDAPGFANMVNKFAMAAPLVGALGALGPSLVDTYSTLQASPFAQALKPAYNQVFNSAIGRIPGATLNNLIKSAFLGEMLSRIDEPIESLKGAYSGEIDSSQAALDVSTYATELAMSSLPMMNLRNAATDVVKTIDAPISKLIAPTGKWLQKNVPLTGKIASELEKIGQLAPKTTPIRLPNKVKPFVPTLNLPGLKDLTTADVLRTQTVLNTLKNMPETSEGLYNNVNVAIDPNASSAERLRALASAGNTTALNLLSMTPLFRRTAPLYNSRLAHGMFLANNAIADDWNQGRSAINLSRLLTRQEGGSTSYVTELSNKEIKELERQGYKVEYLD